MVRDKIARGEKVVLRRLDSVCPDEIMGAIQAFGRLLRVLVLDVRLILVAEFSSQFIASDIKDVEGR